MDKGKLKNYAKLLVNIGGNVQPGQLVIIGCDVDNAYFARMVHEVAYDAGASDVWIDWIDDPTYRARYLRAADEVFDVYPQWKVDKLKHQDENNAVYLEIDASDPELLKGIDSDRIKRASKASREATREHSWRMMTNAQRWSVIAIPSKPWAKMVFPNLSEKKAVESLWELLSKATRADGEDPIAEWAKHREKLANRVDCLNNMNFNSLRFTTGLGSDFTIGLVKNHIWIGGSVSDKNGVPFFPNMPTEEIFTMPNRNRCDGRVVSSMPLSYCGNLIEDFELTFKDGIVEKYSARMGEELLKQILETDEGAVRLGEVALVPNSSPIGQMKTLFYNSLFDENAASHLALGKSYPYCVVGGENLNAEELKVVGGNYSLTHVDFMFGTSDMKVLGIKQDGSEIVVIEKGDFVF